MNGSVVNRVMRAPVVSAAPLRKRADNKFVLVDGSGDARRVPELKSNAVLSGETRRGAEGLGGNLNAPDRCQGQVRSHATYERSRWHARPWDAQWVANFDNSKGEARAAASRDARRAGQWREDYGLWECSGREIKLIGVCGCAAVPIGCSEVSCEKTLD